MVRTKGFAAALLAVVTAVVLGACATPTATPAAPTAAPAQAVETPLPSGEVTDIDPSAVSGDIITAGSSTVFPLSERMAELFQQEGYTGNITVDSIGTGAGFERFCQAGETDIANASRPIQDEERTNCEAIGRTPLEFRVGTDALAVVVSADNTFADALTTDQLKAIFSGEAKTWADVDPTWPAETIQVYSPGTDSGTFDYFVEAVLEKKKESILGVPGAQFSEDDNVLVQGVEGSRYAIGYFGYAYYEEAGSKLKALAIDGVAPSRDTVDDGSYPLARPLFIYSDAKTMADKPQVAAFIGFYLQHVNEEIADVGYFQAPDADLATALETWKSAADASH